MEDRWTELERRLDRAERQVRVLRGTGLLAVISLGAILASCRAVTQTVGSTVKAPFTVVDDRGNVLADLRENEWGGSLIVYDKASHSAGGLYASNAGGLVFLNDAAGKFTSQLDGWNGGRLYTGRVDIGYGRGMSAAVLAPIGDGAFLVIRDTAGNEVARLGATGKGGILTLRNKARDDAVRKELVTLSATAKGGSLTVRAPAGHPVFHKP
jgi:hypothetical protein